MRGRPVRVLMTALKSVTTKLRAIAKGRAGFVRVKIRVLTGLLTCDEADENGIHLQRRVSKPLLCVDI
jgi:hypothetical protein